MPAPGKSLPLFPTATPAARRATPPPRTPPRPAPPPDGLWLAMRFVNLSLDALTAGDAALAIVDEERGRQVVCAANETAVRHGIHAGLSLNAAYALLPQLKTLERDASREQARLRRLAAWAGQFTSQVSIVAPDALLLEIRGSRALFGGVQGVVRTVTEGLNALRVHYHFAVAPTPTGALWIARDSTGRVLEDGQALAAHLGALPLTVTAWPQSLLTTLDGMGVRQVRDCMRLPRDGFSRRFGRLRLVELDRALGRAADPRECFQPPERFYADLELLAETHDLGLIERALGRLIDELAGFLCARQMALEAFDLRLDHLDAPPTRVRVGLSGPSRDAIRLNRVLHERLERLALPAPVVALAVGAETLVPLAGRDGDLFSRSADGYDWPQLVERLRARLGPGAVHGLCLVGEHRPESAWRYVEPGTPGEGSACRQRPLWLLAEPQRLPVQGGRPQRDGALRFVSGPERIETGWWDGRDVARDYYVAVNPAQIYLWVYRQRRAPEDWWLHGVFG